ncbi:MAG: hypothetical protein R3B48_13900 [Kofleriaceae bacterium]
MATFAIKCLVLGGVANLVLSFGLGWVLSVYRAKGPMEPHRWLLVAHEVSLQEGVMLLGLAYAAGFVRLPVWLASGGALAVVIASFFQDASGFMNWLRRTNDQFAEKSLGWKLAGVNAVLNTAGLGILAIGVVRGLLA